VSAPRASRWRRSAFWKASAALHAGAGLGVAVAPAGWPLAAGAVAANHLALALAGMIPRSSLLGPNLTRLPADAAAGVAALSFYGGPDPEITPAVLDRLAAHGARASSFCVGSRVERHPRLTREIRDRGHQVENHSYRHWHAFGFLGPKQLRDEVARAQDAVERAAGRRPELFRAPAGIRNLFLDPVLEQLGLRLVSWTRRGYDTVSQSPQRVAARLCERLRAGDILVLHDGPPVRSARGPAVVLEALSRLLDAIGSRGLRSVPIAEAVAGRRA
jgi:peptidoglycan/xylan/chitin deacetylase (PgdA/CDA1 family)